MSRTPLLAGNWKMFKLQREAADLVRDLVAGVTNHQREVLVCPPLTALTTVAPLLRDTPLRLGCQNVFWEEKGAYTGEISPAMAKDAGCSYAIVGHSERRAILGETDDMCAKKVQALLAWGMVSILCVGETLQEREAGLTQQKVESQVRGALHGLPAAAAERLVIAYEPIWAIGTGKNDSPPEANNTIGFIRASLGRLMGEEAAQKIRILYGGSVKPENIDGFMAQPQIDGALVGGASLQAESFLRIVHYV